MKPLVTDEEIAAIRYYDGVLPTKLRRLMNLALDELQERRVMERDNEVRADREVTR